MLLATILTMLSILEHTKDRIIVKINPTKFTAALLLKSRPTINNASVAFTINYMYKNNPIGVLEFENSIISTIPIEYNRPIINFKKNINKIEYSTSLNNIYINVPASFNAKIMAGPILIHPFINREGQIEGDVFIGVNNGKFLDDAVRKTSHVGIGVDKLGNLIIIYDKLITINEMALILKKYGAVWAMKTDGGHAAYFEITSKLKSKLKYSNSLPTLYGSPLCAMQLIFEGP